MLKRFNAFVYGDKTELPKVNEEIEIKPAEKIPAEPIEKEVSEIISVKEELCEKYLYTEGNGVVGITVENDDQGEFIQFNIECETELQSVDEYKGYRLKFNRLCEIPQEPSEEQILEEYNKLNESFVNFIKNQEI